MELTPAELTILGLVAERPRHGYDLEKVIEQRGIRQWTDVGFSSIYYLLSKLERRGLTDSAGARRGPKARRVFRATAAGRRLAADQALEFIMEPRPVRQPILVGLANLGLFEERYAGAIRERLGRIEMRINEVRGARQAREPLPPAAREVFSYSLSLLEAERTWLASRVPQAADDRQD